MKTEVQTILDHEDIKNKIRRIAYQIYESNVDEKEIILAGIALNGYVIAERLKAILEEVSALQCTLCKVTMNKTAPQGTVETSLNASEYKDKSLVLIDDVLNSGTTLIYGVKHFLDVPLKQFKTAVLVNRNHKKYPVKADFKGISLSTSLNERVKVRFKPGKDSAILE
ncbi:MAG: phosphoribosyltransferase family protein [Bacteroidota bacterium]|uniref:phosphoribosyltransferase family protein n=1 Tax=Leeuwenhoekiella TaxID=283735 RepID=UPI000C4040D3|nr:MULTISPECIES: phosphoribosyltransferase family protein [Leeuwenhoekiella]MBH13539.1 phosphoribosyltransferase [Leeuwenhoekiella sp.]MEC7785059.1 phosphoribosyltransferase family protein [Bacteroidota bacterium]MEE3147435.1 phosphoribosyltransferase family protein [Bacteroidota bacterium]MEE3225908.1 phosphoribosyltransferase family protein [Bacteroidota bacterium]UBZ12219.1 phosphoribosyltransferase [Leeuwenhoekiella palythoae]